MRADRRRLAVATCVVLVATSLVALTAIERPRAPYEHDVWRIARVFDELALPLPERMTLEFYPSAELLTHSLAERSGIAPDVASSIGGFAAGVAIGDTLLFLEPEARRDARAWLRLLAHEMAHLSQRELAGGEQCGARWLVEGTADWIAFAVLDRLGVTSMRVERDIILASSRRAMMRELPRDLEGLAGTRSFLRYAEDVGVAQAYRLAFLLADRLIERHGLQTVATYFRSCHAWADGRTGLERSFRERPEDLRRDVATLLHRR